MMDPIDSPKLQPEIKLTYFNLTGLAEPIRMLLVYMNWEFTDHRIPYEQWLDVKQDMPFGKVPVIELDGEKFHQSRAIGRYLAKKAGLYGIDTPEDDMKIDMLVDTIDDMRQAVTGWYYEKDPVVRKNKFNPMLLDTLPYYLSKLNKMAKENEGFLCKKKQVTPIVRVIESNKSIQYTDDHEDHLLIIDYGPRFKLPLLYVNGSQHYSTRDIMRYLARMSNTSHLMGANDLENMEIDRWADNLNDMRVEINEWNYLHDIEERKERDYDILGVLIPKHLSTYEEMAKKHDGFLFYNDRPTWVDFYFAGVLDYLKGPYHLHAHYLNNYPYLQKLIDNIHSLPRVKDWVRNRPPCNWDWQYMFFYKIG